MNDKSITIVQLYPRDMNIYGDSGNVLVLRRRLEKYGYTPVVIDYNPGDEFPEDVDLIVGGGGQDSGQEIVQADLQAIGPKLHALADKEIPMLMICGLYQLFGAFFETAEGARIDGIGILDIETYGKSERLIGNIITKSSEFGTIVGYENHSGQTFLGSNVTPLAEVVLGAGNNTQDAHEGARYKNVIGSYLHGSLLPKNPAIADFLLLTAMQNKYGEVDMNPIDDTVSEQARDAALRRPR